VVAVKSRGRLLRVLLEAAVSAGLLAVVFLFVAIRSVVAGLQNVDVGYALAGAGQRGPSPTRNAS
jgi:hypothetical protein